MRTETALNDEWYFAERHLAAHGSMRGARAAIGAGFAPVRLPHTVREIPYAGVDDRATALVGSYFREIAAPDLSGGRRAFIDFEAVMEACEVFVDGEPAGGHRGGYTPFSIEITAWCGPGKTLSLLVVADSTEREDIPPFGGVVDYLCYGGIYREVSLRVVPALFLADPAVRCAERGADSFRVAALARLEGMDQAADREGLVLRAELRPCGAADGAPGLLASADAAIKAAAAGDAAETGGAADGGDAAEAAAEAPPAEAAVEFDADGIERWSPDHPALYVCALTLLRRGQEIDRIEVRTGFRTARFEKDGFRLNGKRLFLRGLNRHQSFPYVGCAMPARVQKRDAEILARELGANIVRTSHYPQSRHFLDRCDELGLLVFCELPGWQHIGDQAWQELARTQLEEMILRDRSRPSVVLWGTRINESPDADEFYRKNDELARKLDPTRQTGGVRNFAGSRLLEDVYTYNDFSHEGGNRGVKRPFGIARRRAPYLVSEHNGHMFPTKASDNEARRTEQALRHLRVVGDAARTRGIAGAIGWCMADYNTHKDFGSGDGICHHGVMDMFRIPKYAAAAYRSQAEGEPFGFVASSMRPGDYDAARLARVQVFTNAEDVVVEKNGKRVGVFAPDRKAHPGLPHPPVVVDDFIGPAVAESGLFSAADARTLARYFLALSRGEKPGVFLLIRAGLLMLRRRIGYREGYALYTRFVANWGKEAVRWTFTGRVGGKAVWKEERAALPPARLALAADDAELAEGESWDATRCVVSLVDELGNPAPYSDRPVRIAVSGAAALIGPDAVALRNGRAAFWVRTVGARGEAAVRAGVDGFPAAELRIAVRRDG